MSALRAFHAWADLFTLSDEKMNLWIQQQQLRKAHAHWRGMAEGWAGKRCSCCLVGLLIFDIELCRSSFTLAVLWGSQAQLRNVCNHWLDIVCILRQESLFDNVGAQLGIANRTTTAFKQWQKHTSLCKHEMGCRQVTCLDLLSSH